jgi:histidyl-tRNA synthetase
MGSEKIQRPRGTFDVLPADAERRDTVISTALRVLRRAGYGRIETPIFEFTDLFARGVGESTDIVQKEMFSIAGKDGDAELTLRPEGTAPVVRAYIQELTKAPKPVRLSYAGPFFRRETPQSGRYRQFTQVGAEALGSSDPALDAELITLCVEILEACEVTAELRLSCLGSPDTRAAYRSRLLRWLEERRGDLPADVWARAQLNPLRLFDAADPAIRAVMASAPLLMDALSREDKERFMTVRECLDAVDLQYRVDPMLVRGLDFYGSEIFEARAASLGAQSGVGGGGRYDGLVAQLGGPDTPAAGFAMGVERVLLASQQNAAGRSTCVMLAVAAVDGYQAKAFRLGCDMRRRGLATLCADSSRSLKAQMKQADRSGARWVAICGTEGITLKNLSTGSECRCDETQMFNAITGET